MTVSSPSRRKRPRPRQLRLLQAGRETARQLVIREPARQHRLRDQELRLLRDNEQRARALQGEAAEQLRVLGPGAGDRQADGTVLFTFRPPVAQRLQAADYVHRLSTRILESVTSARGALHALQQPNLPSLRRRELRAIADAALLEVERLRSRGNAYLQREKLEEVEILRQKVQQYRLGRTNAITRAVAALGRDFSTETPQEIWARLASVLGWRIVPLGKSGEAEGHDAAGCRLTYSAFKKRLKRARTIAPSTLSRLPPRSLPPAAPVRNRQP